MLDTSPGRTRLLERALPVAADVGAGEGASAVLLAVNVFLTAQSEPAAA